MGWRKKKTNNHTTEESGLMEKSGNIDPPPPYNYVPPPEEGVPQPMQPAYGAGGVVPPQPGAYPPPQQGYPAQGAPPYNTQPAATTVVIAAQMPMFSANPARIKCVKCGAEVVTETKTVAGLLTWLVCGGLALVGCWVGCCLIPFCIDDCQDIEHWCPNCKTHLGTYKRLS